MLIGYDPADNNRVKFINTDTRYLTRMEHQLGRHMVVADFWGDSRGLESLHVEAFPNIDQIEVYKVEQGQVVPA